MGEDWEDQLEQSGYKFEFSYGYWDYDWSQTAVYSRDGRVFTLSDSGCSCYYWGENFTRESVEGELEQVFDLPGIQELRDQHFGHGQDPFDTQEEYRKLGLR